VLKARPVITAVSGLRACGRDLPSPTVMRALYICAASSHNITGLPSTSEGKLDTTRGVPETWAQLSHLTDIFLDASPSRKTWKVRNKYKVLHRKPN